MGNTNAERMKSYNEVGVVNMSGTLMFRAFFDAKWALRR